MRRFVKLTHIGLWFCMLLFFLYGAAINSGSNRIWYVILFEAWDVIMLARIGYRVLSMPFTPSKMQIRHYRKCSLMLMFDDKIGLFSFGATGAMCLLYLLTHLSDGTVRGELWTMLMFFVCVMIVLFQLLLEKKQHYRTIANEVQVTDDMIIIE
jgi:hypothetical protein